MTEHRRIHVPLPLRWGDLDAFNHVNNVAMLKLLEEARVRAFWLPGPGEDGPPTAVLTSGIDAGTVTLVARHEIEYLAPVPYQRRPLDVQLWFSKIGGSSIEVSYEVWSPRVEDDASAVRALYARAATTVVLADAATGHPVKLTEQMRTAWAPYVGDPIPFRRRD